MRDARPLEGALRSALAGEVRAGEQMARHTTYRIGGPADVFVTCDTVADLGEAVRLCDEYGSPWIVIGKGSNLLVADDGYRGAVLVLGREFRAHRVDGCAIEAGAACPLAYVVRDAYSRGLGGLEFAVGIPGTLGGAIAMNAGSRDAWIGDVLESVTVHIPGVGLERLRADQIQWGYRTAGLPRSSVVVESVLSLQAQDRDTIRRQMDASLERRKRTQPLGVPSAGSVFRNPEGDSAGRLIEAAGLKGTRLGGARISEIHGNFIVNEGGATARDVLGLVAKVQMTVRDTYGIELTPEIRLLGTLDTA